MLNKKLEFLYDEYRHNIKYELRSNIFFTILFISIFIITCNIILDNSPSSILDKIHQIKHLSEIFEEKPNFHNVSIIVLYPILEKFIICNENECEYIYKYKSITEKEAEDIQTRLSTEIETGDYTLLNFQIPLVNLRINIIFIVLLLPYLIMCNSLINYTLKRKIDVLNIIININQIKANGNISQLIVDDFGFTAYTKYPNKIILYIIKIITYIIFAFSMTIFILIFELMFDTIKKDLLITGPIFIYLLYIIPFFYFIVFRYFIKNKFNEECQKISKVTKYDDITKKVINRVITFVNNLLYMRAPRRKLFMGSLLILLSLYLGMTRSCGGNISTGYEVITNKSISTWGIETFIFGHSFPHVGRFLYILSIFFTSTIIIITIINSKLVYHKIINYFLFVIIGIIFTYSIFDFSIGFYLIPFPLEIFVLLVSIFLFFKLSNTYLSSLSNNAFVSNPKYLLYVYFILPFLLLSIINIIILFCENVKGLFVYFTGLLFILLGLVACKNNKN